MKLISDFTDWYDYAFSFVDNDEQIFRRVTTDGMNKIDQLIWLNEHGYTTPPYGKVDDLLGGWWFEGQIKKVVAYTDVNVHCGEGKELIEDPICWEGLDKVRSNLWATAYVEDCVGYSLRKLQIGPHVIWLEYQSTEDWRSNVGDGDINIVGVEKDVGAAHFPLYAIDFVLAKRMYAIDLNIAPGTRGCGIDKLFTAKEIYEAIKGANELLCKK